MQVPFQLPDSALPSLSPQCQQCIKRLYAHKREAVDISGYPPNKLAAVLILLYERSGELRVLLTTRSKTLRSHSGETALPGGKVDESDRDLVATALREANEEVALPLDSPNIYPICFLRPFVSLHRLLVTPVVALLTDPSILEGLTASQSEVDCIFNHPLEAILDPTIALKEPLVPKGDEHWHYIDAELHSTSNLYPDWLGSYRMHRFRTCASPIKGLTAEILITAAEIAYGRPPTYERYAPGQIETFAALYDLICREAQPQVMDVDHTAPAVPVSGPADAVP